MRDFTITYSVSGYYDITNIHVTCKRTEIQTVMEKIADGIAKQKTFEQRGYKSNFYICSDGKIKIGYVFEDGAFVNTLIDY